MSGSAVLPAVLPAVLAGLAIAAWLGLPSVAEGRVESALAREGPAPPRRAAPALAARLQARTRRRGQAERERARAVEACGVLAGELRAGRSTAAALAAAADVASGPTAAALRAASSLGGDVPAALAAAAPTSGVPDLLRGLAACWSVCGSTGSGLAAAVERLGEAERAAAEQRRAVEVELAGPRATARLLALLPLAGLLLAAGLGADPLGFLLGTPAGRACLLLGLGLEVLGLRWTARLADRAAAGR